jgi:hypothetical protein
MLALDMSREQFLAEQQVIQCGRKCTACFCCVGSICEYALPHQSVGSSQADRALGSSACLALLCIGLLSLVAAASYANRCRFEQMHMHS